MIDYAEEIFKSIKTIAKKELESLNYDSTIEATITDNSKAEYGIYTATNGNIYFTAYSTDTNYKEKDVVLVTIPQSDYSKQKIIIGKKNNSDEDKPIDYMSPLSQMIDITNNLVSNTELTFGMVANDNNYAWNNNKYSGKNFIESAYSEIIQTEDDQEQENNNQSKVGLIWSARDYQNSQEESYFKEEMGLTRIGLKADFQTFLKKYNTVSGSYGLVLCVGFRSLDSEETAEENSNLIKIKSTIIQPFIFDSSSFFGDIYNFQDDYTQEVVFDISAYSDLVLSDIFLFAYQKQNFQDQSGTLIPVDEDINNIFIKNFYICLGKEKTNFNGDFAEIYSFSNQTYETETDIKEIKLRWVHENIDLNLIKSLTQEDFNQDYDNKYEIRWYRYQIGAHSPDQFMNMYWERFYGYNIETNKKGDINNDYATNHFNIFLQPNAINNNQEILYALIIDVQTQLVVARCNQVRFQNLNNTTSSMAVRDINALSIKYEDDEEGNYFLYDNMHKLKEGHSGIRYLTAVFAEDIENVNDKEVLQPPFESIKWIFPNENTMISVLNPFDGGNTTLASLFANNTLINENTNFYIDEDNNQIIYRYDDNFSIKWNKKTNNYELIFTTLKNEGDNFYIKIPYTIKEVLDFGQGKNTVTLEVKKNGQYYLAQTRMLFGIFGTSGSEYNLNIVWDNQGHAFNVRDSEAHISGHVEFYDPNNKLINLPDGCSYEYNWYNNKSFNNLDIKSEDNNFSILRKQENENENQNLLPTIDELYVLEVKLVGFGDYNLITRAPIPLINSTIEEVQKENDSIIKLPRFKVDQIDGPISIRYSSNGTVNFDKTPYRIIFQEYINGKYEYRDNTNGYWRIVSKDNKGLIEKNYSVGVPKLVYKASQSFDDLIKFFKGQDLEETDDTIRIRKKLLYRLITETTITTTNGELQLQDFQYLQQNLVDLKTKLVKTLTGEAENQENTIISSPEFIEKIEQYKTLFEDKDTFIQKDTPSNLLQLLSLLQVLSNISIETDINNSFSEVLKSKRWYNYQNDFTLSPCNIYIDNLDLYGVQFVYNSNGQHFTLWTQPIYSYLDNYPSSTLNKWEGELTINEDNNLILAKSIGAGKKDENNTFTGVIFGDWSDDNLTTSKTGIFGFKKGEMSYAFRDDGSAFIGAGQSKISFNETGERKTANITMDDGLNYISLGPGELFIKNHIKNKEGITESYKDLLAIDSEHYYLQSLNYDEKNNTGVKFDLDNGQIKGYNFSLETKSEDMSGIYKLQLSSGQGIDSSFLKISREKKSLSTFTAEKNSLYTQFIKGQNEFHQTINTYYESFMNLFAITKELQDMNPNLFIKNNIDYKEVYRKLLLKSNIPEDQQQYFDDLFIENNEEQELIRNKLTSIYKNLIGSEPGSLTNDDLVKTIYKYHKTGFLNYIKQNLSNLGFRGNYIEDYFSEIPILLINQLSDSQKENLILALKTFLPLTNNDDNDQDINEIFNLHYINHNKNQHLLYPKVHSNQLNGTNLYNIIIQSYDSYLAKMQDKLNNNIWDLDIADQLNAEAKRLIKMFKMPRLHTVEGFSYENFSYVYWKSQYQINTSNKHIDVNAIDTEEKESLFYIQINKGYHDFDEHTQTIPDTELKKSNWEGVFLSTVYDIAEEGWKTEQHRILNEKTEKTIKKFTYFDSQPIRIQGRFFKHGQFTGNSTVFNFLRVRYKNTAYASASEGLQTAHFLINKNNSGKPLVYTFYPSIDDLPAANKAKGNYVTEVTEDPQNPGKYINKTIWTTHLITRELKDSEKYGKEYMKLYCQNLIKKYNDAFTECWNIFTHKINQTYNRFFTSNFYLIHGQLKNQKISDGIQTTPRINIYKEPYICLTHLQNDDKGSIAWNTILKKQTDFYKSQQDDKFYSQYYYLKEGENFSKIAWDDNNIDINNTIKLINILGPQADTNYMQYNILPIACKLYKDNLLDNNKILYFSRISTCLSNFGNPQESTWIKYRTYYEFSELGLKVWEESNSTYLNWELNNTADGLGESCLFDSLNWKNELININKNGGYMTSKDYRPTMASTQTRAIEPTSNQGTYNSNLWYQGMTGFVIDFTHNRFVLGNGAQIQGFQSQFYPGETDILCRTFYISTGANYSPNNDRGIVTDTQYFIQAYEGYPGRLQPTFLVKWNGDVHISGNLYVDGEYC